MRKLYKKFKRFKLYRYLLVTLVLISTLSISCFAIGDNNSGVLAFNFDTKVAKTVTSNPSSTSGYQTKIFQGTNQVGFVIPNGNNDFSSSNYRYCTFNLQNTNSQTFVVTIRFVAYYGEKGNDTPFGFDTPCDAWVNGHRYGLADSFDYSQTDLSGKHTFNGGQFSFGLNPNSSVSVVLLAGLQEFAANALFFNIDIAVVPYNSNKDIINNQNQNTQDIMNNQNENADKINGTIDEIFNGENYEGATDEHEKMDDYSKSEQEVTDFANDKLDSVKSDMWDTNLLNPNVNTPIKGFMALSMIFDTFLEDCPSFGYIAKISIAFGILAFVLGLALAIYRGRK